MHLSIDQHYPTDPNRVYALLTNEAFLASAAVELGAVEHKVTANAEHSTLEAVVSSPAKIRRFVGPTVRLAQETTWGEAAPDGSRSGKVGIKVLGSPVSLTGTLQLVPSSDGSTLTYDGELKVGIPLVGPSIEKAAAPAINRALAAQERAARRWLAHEPD
ncbi:MAG: DUF2505 domain-containing protein [Propioniciclava sp.]